MWWVINLIDSFILLSIGIDPGPSPPRGSHFLWFWLLFADIWCDLLEEDFTFVLYLLRVHKGKAKLTPLLSIGASGTMTPLSLTEKQFKVKHCRSNRLLLTKLRFLYPDINWYSSFPLIQIPNRPVAIKSGKWTECCRRLYRGKCHWIFWLDFAFYRGENCRENWTQILLE